MKIVKVAISVTLLATLLSGCTTKYTKSDVTKYIKEELNVTNSFSIENSFTKEDDDGYKDTYYTVHIKDDYLTTFYVVDDTNYGSEWAANHLVSDYYSVRNKQAYDNYANQETLTLVETESENNDLTSYKIKGLFSTKEQLDTLIDDVETFNKKLKKDGALSSFTPTVQATFSYPINTYTIEENFDLSKDTDETYKKYIFYLMHYQLPEGELDKFSSELKEEALDVYGNNFHVGLIQDDGFIQYFDDLSARSYRLSVGGLYRILQATNYPMSGDITHFSFVGQDGTTYDIRYDGAYIDADGDLVTHYVFYSASDIERMTGLSIYVGPKNQ